MTKIHSFNDEQRDAISSRNSSILVSAPAGSGKTKILVSRILSLLEQDHIEIDQLLVLTFTNAAALEMKQRLEVELSKRLQEDIDDTLYQHLLNQKQKLPQAYITNFHGFCSTLLKQYGYLIQIQPDFQILSETSYIKHQVLDDCICTWLNEPAFKNFLQLYFHEYNFNSFQSTLLKLAEFNATIYDFNNYLDHIYQTIYHPIINQKDLDQTLLKDIIKDLLKQKAIEGKNKTIELKNYCRKHGLTFFYQNPETKKSTGLPTPFESYLLYFYQILQELDQSNLTTFLNKKITLPKTYSASFDDQTRPYQKEYNKQKTAILKPLQTILNDCIYQNKEEFSIILEYSWNMIETILTYLKKYLEAYQNYKQKRNYLDFNDLECYALKLLEPNYHVVDDLYHQLKEIMIDEYQDTNQIQETLIQKIATFQDPNIPCFMVGDMKQSIYRFRQADPQIFQDKYSSYSLKEEDVKKTKTKRIDLKFNYRSNKIVLDSVNYIFDQIMDQEIGGLDYYLDPSAQLNYDYARKEGAKDTSEIAAITSQARDRLSKETRFTTEVLLTSKQDCKTKEPEEYEAYMVAKKVSELVTSLQLDNPSRTCTYKDIVVLMRNAKEFVTFKKVFDRMQIPNHIVLSQGFLSTPEIVNSIAILQALNNPLHDIAFTSVLLGNYTKTNFDEEFLLSLKTDETLSIYENLCLSNHPRIQEFITYFDELKQYSTIHTVKDTLEKFYQDNDYISFVSSLINGKQRKANLELFLQKLKEDKDLSLYEITSKYETMMQENVNVSPAQVQSKQDNAVSFMTIHKSKGLEFPVVFISQLHHPFNMQDSKARMMLDKQLGIALKPRIKQDLGEYQEVIIEYVNKYRKIIGLYQNQETINEEMRIFYVALTRASQKLILTGVMDSIEQFQTWQEAIINNEDQDILNPRCDDHVLLYRNLRNVNSYLQWLGLAMMSHPDIIKQCLQDSLITKNEDAILSQTLHQNAATIQIFENKHHHFTNTEHSKFKVHFIPVSKIEEAIVPIHFKRPSNSMDLSKYHNYLIPIHETEKTIAVTRKIEDGDRVFARYEESSNNIKATDRGTIIHKVMEYLPIQKDLQLKDFLTSLYPLFETESMKLILDYQDHIQAFLHSPIYQLLLSSDKVYKEKKFSFVDENKQIIHGIFDVVCINKNKITIIDYKTDQLKATTSKQTLKQLHRPQMEYYKYLFTKIFSGVTIEAVVYYLYIDKYVIL